MKTHWLCPVVACLVLATPATTLAQGVDVGVSGLALLSLQPVDDSYVGGPYLSPDGIGGVGPGVGAGVNVVFANGLTIAGEFSTAWFELAQNGRLVPGPRPPEPGGSSVGGSGITNLHDSLLSGLVGYATRGGGTRMHFLAGVAARLNDPTVNGTAVADYGLSDADSRFPLVLTGGVDMLHSISPRVSIVFSARYAWIDRFEQERYLGIGSNVLRAGGGLRVRIN